MRRGWLPGGRCARAKIVGWSEARDLGQLIRSTFETLRTRFEADPERPSIEFYRSQRELIVFLPVRGFDPD